MVRVVLPILVTAGIWWSMTGLILYLNRRPPHTFPRSLAVATTLLVAALVTLHTTAMTSTVNATYESFAAAIVVWGWLEMTFLMGFLTGPQRHGCPPGCRGLAHFGHAIAAIFYHEIAIIACAAAIYLATAGEPGSVGLKAFLLLWGMRQSAKLNLFLGVPNLGEVYLPAHIRYLASLFRRRPMNLLFPLSVTLATLACVYFVRAALIDTTAPAVTGDTMLATLTALGLLEHWFLVLPLPTESLWKWSLKPSAAPAPTANSYRI